MSSLYRLLRKQWIKAYGTFRDRERMGLLKRPAYAYGLLRAADMATYFGWRATTVCEFGVARGNGLLSMIGLAKRLSAETGVHFRVVGFDTGAGLPPPMGYKDHPEIWSVGDYPMPSDGKLAEAIKGRAELVLGDIKDTVTPFVASLEHTAPLGFVAVDVDIYTSTKHVLRCLSATPEFYTPAVSVYLDDVGHFLANRWCGELAAIEEFNAEHELRKIDRDRSRRHLQRQWFQGMYACHILDHPLREKPDPNRKTKVRVGGNLPRGVMD